MKKLFSEIICGALILLFVYAAFSKLFSYGDFKSQLSQLPFPHSFVIPVSILLPGTELFVTFLLASYRTRKTGLLLSLLLLILFTVFICCMLIFEKHLPCSCGGVLSKLTWKQHFLINLFFVAISYAGIRLERTNKNIVVRQSGQRSLLVS